MQSPKLRVAFFFSLPLCNVYGGGEKVLSELLSNIDLKYFDVTLVIEHPKIHPKYLSIFGDRIKIISIYNYSVGYYKQVTTNKGAFLKWKYFPPSGIVRELSKFFIFKRKLNLIAKDYDIIIDHDPFHFVKYFSKYNIKTKAKIIGWHHTDYDRFLTSTQGLKKGMQNPLLLMDGVFFVSKYIMQRSIKYIADINNKLSKKLFFTPNGIDVDNVKKLGNIVNYGLNESELKLLNSEYILIAARVSKTKGHLILISAFKKILNQFPHMKLICIGALGDAYAELNEYVIENNLGLHVSFLGVKENPYLWMKFAKLVVLPSIAEESFGLVILESMVFGKKIIASDLLQIKETYVDSIEYFATGDSDELATRILNYLILAKNNNHIIDYSYDLNKYSILNSTLIFEEAIKALIRQIDGVESATGI